MNKSNYLRNKQLDNGVGGQASAAAATLYFALYTVAPTAAGGGTEVSGGGYARKSVTNNLTNFPAASAGTKSNATSVDWSPATGDWGTLTAVGVFDAASGGNLLYFASLTTPRIVATDTVFSFPAASLVWNES